MLQCSCDVTIGVKHAPIHAGQLHATLVQNPASLESPRSSCKRALMISITPLSPSSPTVRYGFILVHDTLCHGVVPAEWGGDDDVVLYDTRTEAEFECVDAAEMRAASDREAQMEPENDEDGFFIEEAVLHADGSLTLLNLGRAFTAHALRALTR